MDAGRRVVIGVGNEFRRDDGIGPRVVAELAAGAGVPAGVDLRIDDGDPARLLDLWAGAALAVVIDAIPPGAGRPGTWLELTVDGDREVETTTVPAGSHSAGFGSTVALGRLLGRVPERLVVLAVHGREFGFGTELSDPVRAAMAPVTARVRALLTDPG